LKKSGFFDESIKTLNELEDQLMEALKESNEETFNVKKLVFKVYRDKARLYALKRDETKAKESHAKAERIYKEELYKKPEFKMNIKLAKL
jgi:hypothetical protein